MRAQSSVQGLWALCWGSWMNRYALLVLPYTIRGHFNSTIFRTDSFLTENSQRNNLDQGSLLFVNIMKGNYRSRNLSLNFDEDNNVSWFLE